MCEQRSQEWFDERCGVPTSSNFSKIITSKGEISKSREGYLHTLVAQRMSGIVEEGYSSRATAEGIRREKESRQVYGMEQDVLVDEVGFCLDDSGLFGCSPDGLVGEDGGVELKNPEGKTQVALLLDPKLPSQYFHQVQGSLLVSGRKWWDFVSYYPGMRMLIIRVFPDEDFHVKLRAALVAAAKEIDALCKSFKKEMQR